MLERCKTAQERWGGVHAIIDRWLHQRKMLVESWSGLYELGEFTPTDTVKIQAFCELLVDYVSTGHFEVYEQLAMEAKDFHDDTALQCFRNLMPKIEANTEIVLEFQDKYDTKEHCNALLVDLPLALQTLGLVMDERFGYEDQLIEELHEAHTEQSA
ncbi:sigma D regulator [Marinomonas piezotolerans]|uniref:Sigma D regulator n=1 Tax=Marinomonas piezotolerans TaxID=2213058 RepID=A0A370U6I0_9GAMM|nr:sigma D regulator [Marinomonas piezotolerans]RDL43368.1 sigma D regulator [Marinomonas piezotolerans]